MGHYHSDMYSPFHDRELRTKYNKNRVAEIEDIVSNNPLVVEDLSLDDKLVLYREFFKPSKVAIDSEYKPSSKVADNLHVHPAWSELHLRFARLYQLKGFFHVHELFPDKSRVRVTPKSSGLMAQTRNLVKPVGFFEPYSEKYDMRSRRW